MEKLHDEIRKLENLVHMIGHELRGSLSTIAINAELIELAGQNEPMPLTVDSSIDTIKESMRSATELLSYIDQMAVFQDKPNELEVISLDSLIEQVLDRSRTSLLATETQVDVSPGLPHILGKSVGVNRVLQNVIDNSIKYRHPERPSSITLTAESCGDFVHVHVQDTGRGIPEGQKH